MRKLIASFIILGLSTMTLGPVVGIADNTVTTQLTKGTGGGSTPIVKAKWEMKGPCFTDPNDPTKYTCDATNEGQDDDPAAGAQFEAPGKWNGKMKYTVCAIVTDPDGVSDIYGVYADIYYPNDRSFHENPAYPDPHADPYAWTSDSGSGDIGLNECGAFIEQNTLYPLSKADGYRLFCETIRNENDNLPTFFGSYDYNEICGPDGELMKETAKVYCADKELIWEDPAGDYKVEIIAQDNSGNSSDPGVNVFTYLETTGFQKDFNTIDYGTVMLNVDKKVAGDLDWDSGGATIRNIGNTRLSMWIAQDDMGLGQSSGEWNVRFDARVGNHELDWLHYDPFGFKGETPVWDEDYKQLEDVLDLSEVEEMDFSILVTKWPNTDETYTGTMWLGAKKAPFRNCPP